jgi:adenylate kinase family enzyme
LGERLGLEVLHLDRFYWRAGWVETPKEEWAHKVEGLVAREAWVMDGNYSGTLGRRLEACDTVVFIDLPRLVCVWRVLKRLWTSRWRGRPDMAEGCGDKFSPKFLKWVWDYPERSRPKVLAMLDDARRAGKNVVRLRSDAEVERFLEGL